METLKWRRTSSHLLVLHSTKWTQSLGARVKQATLRDEDLQQLKSYIINSFPPLSNTLPSNIQPYWRHDLSIVDEVILVGDRILISPALREVFKLLHCAHQGTSAMNERAKSSHSMRGFELLEKCYYITAVVVVFI